jgi:cell division protein FtsQ
MKKLKKILSWLLMMLYILVMLIFISARSKDIKIDKIAVVVKNDDQNRFVSEKDIIRIFKNENINLIGAQLESVDINHIEEALSHQPSVKHADVYRNPNGEIGVKIEQRFPVLRVINDNQESYYIDAEGTVMPLSTRYTAHVVIANGHIHEPFTNHVGENLARDRKGEYVSSGELLPDLYQLVTFIDNDRFWKAQIEQIYVNEDKEFELIPRVGNHVIILGSTDKIDIKFRNLRALYEDGFSKDGWNKYRIINLKYDNQIVCTKR